MERPIQKEGSQQARLEGGNIWDSARCQRMSLPPNEGGGGHSRNFTEDKWSNVAFSTTWTALLRGVRCGPMFGFPSRCR